MERKEVMTASWFENEEVFKKLSNGHTKDAKNFGEFVFKCPMPFARLYESLERTCRRSDVADITNIATISEDSVLFDCSCDGALDIIGRYLKILNTGGKVRSLWCFLDTERKAVVHFIMKRGWYAEAYFLSDEEFSALHITDDEYGKNIIVANFSKNISSELKKASLNDCFYLQEYLPRTTGDILGRARGSNKKKNNSSSTKKTKHNTSRADQKSRHDKWDGL